MKVSIRAVHLTRIYFVMIDSSVSTRRLTDAAEMQKIIKMFAGPAMRTKLPRVPETEKIVDQAMEAPKNAIARSAARFFLIYRL